MAFESKILLFLPENETHSISELLGEAGIEFDVCESMSDFNHKLHPGITAIIVGQEMLQAGDCHNRAEDANTAMIVFVESKQDATADSCGALLSQHPNSVLLERPVRPLTFLSTVASVLRAHHRQLEIKTQLQDVQATLRENEDQFRILTEQAPVAFGIVQGTRFVLVNKFFAQFSGYTKEELLNMDFPALVHPAFRDIMIDRATRRQRGEEAPQHYEFLAVDKHGQEHWFDFSPALIEYKGAPAIIGAGLEITERKRAEAALERREASYRLLRDTATRLIQADPLDQALAHIFDDVSAHVLAPVYFFYRVTPDGARLHLHTYRGIDDGLAQQVEYMEFGQPLCGVVAQEKRRMIVQNVLESTSPDLALLRSLGIGVYACHPLLLSGDVLGTIAFCARDRGHFTDEHIDIMRTVADQASMALAREHLTLSLEQRASALDQANRAKDQFLAVLSHELRTPLMPVLAAVSMLHKTRGTEAQTIEKLEMIRRNVELEARLIDDLLDLTRIARGKVELQKTELELGSIIYRAVEVCQPDIEANSLHLKVDFDGGALYRVEGDAARLQQVFWNLLKNAIKFTPEGGCLAVTCRSEGAQAVVDFIDSGVGIEPAAIGRIFDAFAQADPAVTRQFGGLGLGLAISKSLLELHGGTIEACSEGRNKGTTMTVRLPLLTAEPVNPQNSVKKSVEVVRPHGLRLLVVDDHRDTLEMIKLLLESEGYEVETSDNVASALSKTREKPLDMIISDLGLPDGSGLDLMRELRSRGQSLPGIALSGYGQESDVAQTREAGFQAHLVKPVDADRLMSAINSVAASLVQQAAYVYGDS